jgi:hypothetical protein
MIKRQTGRIKTEEDEKEYASAEYFDAETGVLNVLLSGDSGRKYTPYLELLSL